MNEINSFTFYRDYYYLIDTMPIEDKRVLAVAILDYVFKDEIPNLNGHNQAIFNTLSHQLNLSKNNSKRSTGNGAPKGNTNASKKQTKNKPKTNQKQTGEVTENKQNSILSFKFYISNFKFINNNTRLISKLEEWFKYKSERKEKYKETGLKTLLGKIDNYTEKHGCDNVISLINESMANNYKGIIFEKLDKQPKTKESIPEWFNKDIQKKEVSEENKKKMEEILREYK